MLLLFPNNDVFLCLEANNGLTLGLFLPLVGSDTGDELVDIVLASVTELPLLFDDDSKVVSFLSTDSSSGGEPADVSSVVSSEVSLLLLADFSVVDLSGLIIGAVSEEEPLLLPGAVSAKLIVLSVTEVVAGGLFALRNGNLGLDVDL